MTHIADIHLGSAALESTLAMALPCLHSLENEECTFRSLGEPYSGSSHWAELYPGEIFPMRLPQTGTEPCLNAKKEPGPPEGHTTSGFSLLGG